MTREEALAELKDTIKGSYYQCRMEPMKWQSKHGTGGTVMFDGKWDAKEATECWVIKNRKNGNVVFSYRTHRGNEKKALFTAAKYAEEALNKYIRNPEDYYISII